MTLSYINGPRSMYTRVDGPHPGWLDPRVGSRFSSAQNVHAA